MHRFFQRTLAMVLASLVSAHVFAAPPKTINYQGVLTNSGGTPVNTSVSMTFRLYYVASGGTVFWTEIQPAVAVTNGLFNVLLGSVTAIPLDFNDPYWLGVSINADAEMSPRQPLASSPYALRATTITGSQISGGIDGGQITGNIGGAQITGTINNAAVSVDGARLINTLNAAGNIAMVNSTATIGNILKGGSRFIHNFGTTNTFVGVNSGNFTISGFSNTAVGTTALQVNGLGNSNAAFGAGALTANVGGSRNTALGTNAMLVNDAGSGNVAVGHETLANNTSGTNNLALGEYAGGVLTTGTNNIYLKADAAVNNEANTIRIGSSHTRAFIAGVQGASINGNTLSVSPNGQLGINVSSGRFKDEIADIGDASSRLMQLRPVSFRYKAEFDEGEGGVRQKQYGLVAEEVAELYPELISRDADGKILTVRYHFLPPMLLNEVQKQQRTIDTQATRIDTLEQELREIKALLRGQRDSANRP